MNNSDCVQNETCNISTGEEGLAIAIILALVLRPVLELDRGIAAGADAFLSVDGIALVAYINIGDVVHDLIVKLRLCCRI